MPKQPSIFQFRFLWTLWILWSTEWKPKRPWVAPNGRLLGRRYLAEANTNTDANRDPCIWKVAWHRVVGRGAERLVPPKTSNTLSAIYGQTNNKFAVFRKSMTVSGHLGCVGYWSKVSRSLTSILSNYSKMSFTSLFWPNRHKDMDQGSMSTRHDLFDMCTISQFCFEISPRIHNFVLNVSLCACGA